LSRILKMPRNTFGKPAPTKICRGAAGGTRGDTLVLKEPVLSF